MERERQWCITEARRRRVDASRKGSRMRIERAELVHLRLPLVEPFRISSGAISAKDTVIVRLHAEGEVGCGESCSERTPHYSYDLPKGNRSYSFILAKDRK